MGFITDLHKIICAMYSATQSQTVLQLVRLVYVSIILLQRTTHRPSDVRL